MFICQAITAVFFWRTPIRLSGIQFSSAILGRTAPRIHLFQLPLLFYPPSWVSNMVWRHQTAPTPSEWPPASDNRPTRPEERTMKNSIVTVIILIIGLAIAVDRMFGLLAANR